MNKKDDSSGLSLVEVIIGTMLFTLMAMGITKVMRTHVFVLHKSDLMTTAAALASDIAARIKTQPFNYIYSYDSAIPHPQKPLYPAFKPNDYLIDIDESHIKPVLLEIQNAVETAGFNRFKIGITYLRRDSSDNSMTNTKVDDYAYWGKGGGTFLKAPTVGCDQLDSNLCFGDYNNDGDYWDVVGDIPETPDSGLKLLTISVFKNNEPVGVNTGTLLTKGNFSGNEIQDSQSPLKLKIVYPKKDIWAMQATPETMAALQLPTRRTYLKSRWHINSGLVVRIDTNNALNPVLNKRKALDGTLIPPAGNPEQFSLAGGGNNLIRFAGKTDPGASGNLRVYDSFATSAYAGSFAPTETVNFTPSGANWEIWNAGGGFTTLSGPLGLMRDGNHWLWSRKESAAGSNIFSPFDVRKLRVDYGIPRVTQFSPDTPLYSKGGLTPYNVVTISDYFKVGGGASNYSGVVKDVVSAIVSRPGINEHYYVKSGGAPNNVSFSVASSSSVVSLRDHEWFPPKFLAETLYTVTWEFGDYVGYKGSHTYTFKIPDPVTKEASFNTPPVYGINTAYPASYPVIVRTPAGYTPVRSGIRHSFIPLLFYDNESGINLRTFKLEVCKDVALPAMVFGADTPNCKTVYEYLKKRPDSSAWGAWFVITPLGNQIRTSAAVTFSSPGVGVLAGQSYPVGSTWKIRASMQNWAGLTKTTGDNDWRIQIVNP